jgi:hypothetical protein
MANSLFVSDRDQIEQCESASAGNRHSPNTVHFRGSLSSRPSCDVVVAPPLLTYGLALFDSGSGCDDRGQPLPITRGDETSAGDGIRVWRSGQRRHAVWSRPSHAGAHPPCSHQLRLASLDGRHFQPSQLHARFLNLHLVIEIPSLKFRAAEPERSRCTSKNDIVASEIVSRLECPDGFWLTVKMPGVEFRHG